eukprot:1159873-Pelagomonas_calceolata.AAC.19
MPAVHACSPQHKPKCVDGQLSNKRRAHMALEHAKCSADNRRDGQDLNCFVTAQSSLKGSCSLEYVH